MLLRGYGGCRARPVRPLVARRVARGVVWAGGGGSHRCRVWGLVMQFPLVAAGGGARGGVCQWGLGMVGVGGGLHVVCLWSGSGRWGGGDGVGVALLVAGWAKVVAVLEGSLGVPPGLVDVVFA